MANRNEQSDLSLTNLEARVEDLIVLVNECHSSVRSLKHSRSEREWFSVGEVAGMLAKAAFTVREWCRLGRIRANKQNSESAEWRIHRDEVRRYQEEGLLPPASR